MPQILVRNVDKKAIEHLKRRARAQGRSLQSEVKAILERAANDTRLDSVAAASLLRRFRSKLKAHKFSDSAVLIREARR